MRMATMYWQYAFAAQFDTDGHTESLNWFADAVPRTEFSSEKIDDAETDANSDHATELRSKIS